MRKSTKQADIINDIQQYYDKITAPGFDLTSIGLTPDDVTRIGARLAAAKAGLTGKISATETKKAKTGDLSGPGGLLDQLVEERRSHNNKIRMSDASDSTCLDMGVPRRKANPTPKTIGNTPPDVVLEGVTPGFIRLRVRDTVSASPRARATNANGMQVAIVSAAGPKVAGEVDSAPYRYASRSPFEISSDGLAPMVRIYVRWQTQTGLISGWSVPITVTVMPK